MNCCENRAACKSQQTRQRGVAHCWAVAHVGAARSGQPHDFCFLSRSVPHFGVPSLRGVGEQKHFRRGHRDRHKLCGLRQDLRNLGTRVHRGSVFGFTIRRMVVNPFFCIMCLHMIDVASGLLLKVRAIMVDCRVDLVAGETALVGDATGAPAPSSVLRARTPLLLFAQLVAALESWRSQANGWAAGSSSHWARTRSGSSRSTERSSTRGLTALDLSRRGHMWRTPKRHRAMDLTIPQWRCLPRGCRPSSFRCDSTVSSFSCCRDSFFLRFDAKDIRSPSTVLHVNEACCIRVPLFSLP